MAIVKLTRRRILATAAGGALVVGGAGLWFGVKRLQNERFRIPVDREGFSPNVYLGILPDNSIHIWITRSEMGQGISTALALLIAEDLDADWSRVVTHQAPASAEQDYGRLFTAASSSIASTYPEFRRAGALAREMLVSAAAEKWGVSTSECFTRAGYVEHGEKRVAYGDLVDLAADQRVPLRPTLKDAAQFNLIGHSPPRLDIPAKVTGETRYGLDWRLREMVRAMIVRPPTAGQTPVAIDDTAARKVRDVLDVLSTSHGVAIVARTTPALLKARAVLNVEWSTTATGPSSRTLSASLSETLSAATVPAAGEALPSGLTESHRATYEVPFLNHACMESMNCTAWVDGDSCEIWVGTQAPEGARQTAAGITGLPLDRVVVNVLPLGGGFGRRAGQDFVAEAVEIASRLDVPVQLLWTREDDLAHGAFRDAAMITIAAMGDGDSSLALRCRMATATKNPSPEPGIGPVMGWDNLAYDLSGVEARWAGLPTGLQTTIWRSVGYSYNTFAIECFMDELAELRGEDPVTFRRSLLPDGSPLIACLDLVIEESDWYGSDSAAMGLATFNFGSTAVALVASVVGDETDWQVDRVWCVADCGTVVHADSAAAQLEGGIVFGLSAALYETVDLDEGVAQSRNYHQYRIARMSDTPRIQVRLLTSDRYPSGLGEASTPAIAPAVANALYRLTGKRFRKLPLKA